MRSTSRFAAALLSLQIACSSQSAHKVAPVVPTPEVASPPKPSSPPAEVSAGGGVVTSGRPISLDETIPGQGFSARDLVQRVAQMPRLPLAFEPWWTAPSQTAGQPAITLEVVPGDSARWNGQSLELDVRVRLFDPNAASSSAPLIDVPGIVTGVPPADGPASAHDGLGDSWLTANFESAELAQRWALPPAAPSQGQPNPPEAGLYDVFHVGAGFSLMESGSAGAPPRSWSGQLHSIRAGNHCLLAQTPAAAPTRCQAYSGLLVVRDESAVREIGLSESVTSTFTPRAALNALEHSPALYTDWPDGDVEGKRTEVQVHARALGFACVVPANVPVQNADRPMSYESGIRVVTPVELSVASTDGRLRATLPGLIEALPITNRRWDKSMTVAGGAPLELLAARKERPGFVVPSSGLGSLGITLYMPVSEDVISQLAMQVWQPYPGVPAFPAVSELSSNRVSCFATPDFRAMREAHLSPRP